MELDRELDREDQTEMENTGKVLFGDDVPQWYVALGERWEGPLTASAVYQKVLNQEITWAHYVWKPGKSGWERICDLPEFHVAVPPLPTKVPSLPKATVRPSARQSDSRTISRTVSRNIAKTPPPSPSEEKSGIWFIYDQDTQLGPFRNNEMVGFIQNGRVNGSIFAWRDGMDNWERLEKLDAFQDVFKDAFKESVSGPKKKIDQRGAPRRPLIAKILMAKGDQLVTAICRDISIGGLQVLTDRIPGPVGSVVKMNVSMVGKKAGKTIGKTKIEPFVAEGVIVRILEDGRGFSFRFNKLSDTAKRAIEAYINATSE